MGIKRKRIKILGSLISFIILCTFFVSCSGEQKTEFKAGKTEDSYKPTFPPDIPFNPKEWQTNENYRPIGDPNAKKGGTLVISWPAGYPFPPTLRGEGPNSNLQTISEIHGMVYESLVGLHPETLEFIPALAQYWQISKDKRTFRFRINPKARWADGSEVTSDDVLASWEHLVDPEIKDPYQNILFGQSFEKPIIEDKYTIKVKTKELNWRLFLYFGGSMKIYPAKYIRIPGKDYLKKYQWKMIMGSGPYELKESGIVKEKSITLTRRKDYWGDYDPKNVGLNNFDKIKWIVIMDEELQFEKFKKGEFDYYSVNKAQRWVEETIPEKLDKVKKGWIQRRKIYNFKPEGFGGFVFNMRKPPFNDKRVRQAFAYLFNREKLIEKLFFNEYKPIDSYYPNSVWGNPNNPKIRYNPKKAAELLAAAGWKKRNSEGILVDKNNKPFEVTLEYYDPGFDRIFTVVAEDMKKAGIKLNLKLIDQRTLLKKTEERNFLIHYQNWTALIFPNPESSWMSDLADKPSNNNLPGFKNKKVDELCKKYNVTFDQNERIKIIREIDSLIFNEYPYALGWYKPYTERILYWNKFGYPKTYFTKIGGQENIKSLWWIDPEKEKALEEAMKNDKSLPVGEIEVRPWK